MNTKNNFGIDNMTKTKALIKKTPNQIIDPTKLEGLSKAELLKVVKQTLMPVNDPELYKAMVRASLPEFAKEVDATETRGTAIFEAAQEMMLVVFDCLRRYHKFTESDLKRLNVEIQDVLNGVKEFETEGLSMLSQHSMTIVGDNVEDLGIGGLITKIAQVRERKARMQGMGMEMDKLPEKPFERRAIKGGSKR